MLFTTLCATDFLSQGHLPIQICICGGIYLAQAQTNAVPFRVNLDDPQGDHIPFMDNLFRMRNSLLAQFGYVDQTFQVLTDARKGAEFGQMGDRSLDQDAFSEVLNPLNPRVVLQLADGQANPFAVTVDADDLHFNFLTDFKDLVRVTDTIPGDLGKMDQTVGPFNVDERSEICQAGHSPGAYIALIQFLQQAIFQRFTGLLDRQPFGEDQPASFPINLNDAHHDRFINHPSPALLRGIAAGRHAAQQADLGCRHETTQLSDRDDQPALVIADDRALNDLFHIQHLSNELPVLFFFRPDIGKHNISIIVLRR